MPDPTDLLRAAAALGASDLVYEPQDGGGLLAVARVDGVRASLGTIPASEAASAIARLKALARLPAYITREVQDGRLPGTSAGVEGELRLSVLPTVRGQRLAVRLPALGPLPAPEGLGLPAEAVATLRAWLRRPDGLVVVAGPTGSGKTTTIHSLLAELAAQRPDRQVVAVEDPVERLLPGVVQSEADPAGNLGILDLLRASLRQDPDVIVVGEVRDAATATAALRAALTGHLVVTTVHTGRAHEVVPRLVEQGVDPDLLLPALAGVLAQRLVRVRHAGCGGAGCPGCRGGWRGRQAVCDLLAVDGEARRLLRAGGRPPLACDLDRACAALVEQGRTDAAEVARVAGAG